MATKKTTELSIIPIAKKRLNMVLSEAGVSKEKVDALIKKHKGIKVTDNDTYLTAKAAKMEFVKCRTSGTPVFKKFRDPLNEASKWVKSEEDEYVANVAIGEDPISKEIDAYEAKLKAEQDQKDREQALRLVNRNNQLTALGVLEDEGNRILDTISFTKHEIETSEDEGFAIMLNAFKEKRAELDYEANQANIKKELAEKRRNDLMPYMPFLSAETTTMDLSTLSDDEFGAILSVGVKEKEAFDMQKQKLAEQKAQIDMQIHATRSNELIDWGFEIGYHAIIGFGKQYPLSMLDINEVSDDQFKETMPRIKAVIAEYEAEQLKAKQLDLILTNRTNELLNIGFRVNGDMFEYENMVFTKQAVQNVENWDAFVEQMMESITDLKEAKKQAEIDAKAESEASMSDSEKWKAFLVELGKLEVPTAKSKKFTKFNSALELINKIKSL